MKSRILFGLSLAALCLLSLFWLIRLDWADKVSTDVMDLLPRESSHPQLQIGRSVLEKLYSKKITVLLRGVSEVASKTAYIEHLEASSLVSSVLELSSSEAIEGLGRFLFEQRLALLFPDWLAQAEAAGVEAEGYAAYVVERLDAALGDPDIVAFESVIPSDPLLLMRSASDSFAKVGGTAMTEDSMVLLEVELAVSTLSPEGQEPVFALLTAALAAGQALDPGMTALDTGAHRYAWATEHHMRQEVKWLNFSTLAVVLVICLLLCRRLTMVFHLFLILGLSLLTTTALVTALFNSVHVFALVFGCVLCGVIIDYGLHAYLHDTGEPKRNLKTFLRPFLISCGSTLVGFCVLIFSDLPVLRQMGAFVSCGLVVAAVVTVFYCFGILRTTGVPMRGEALLTVRFVAYRWVLVLFAGALLALPMVEWDDDIRSLKYPLPELEAQEAEIRAVYGGQQSICITFGADFSEARASLAAFEGWLTETGVSSDRYISAARWVPTEAAYFAGVTFAQMHSQFGEAVMDALEQGGYDQAMFVPFLSAWSEYCVSEMGYGALVSGFSNALGGALDSLVGENGHLYWWVTLIDTEAELGEIPEGLHTLKLSQVERMSEVLSEYRKRTLQLSLLAAAAIAVILMLVFKWKSGAKIALIPLLAVTAASILLSGGVGALGIFHLVGLFLGGCLVLDYAVFTWIRYKQALRIPASVFVSALTTGLSFLILSFSKIEAIHALGVAVSSVTFLGFLLAYFFVPSGVQSEVES